MLPSSHLQPAKASRPMAAYRETRRIRQTDSFFAAGPAPTPHSLLRLLRYPRSTQVLSTHSLGLLDRWMGSCSPSI